MKRKSLEDLFDDLHITLNKKLKTSDKSCDSEHEKMYTQSEVNELLKSQELFLITEFKRYIESMRNTSEFNIPKWTC